MRRALEDAHVLLERWRTADDREALDELLRQEVDILKGRLRRRDVELGGSASVSDVAQETILRFLRQEEPPRFADPRQLRAYLWKAAWNLLVDRMRDASKPVLLEQRPSGTSDDGPALTTTGGIGSVERRDGSFAIQLALNLLAAEDREILDLVYLQGFEISAAARELGLSHGAANMRLVRARRSLAQKLKHWAEFVG